MYVIKRKVSVVNSLIGKDKKFPINSRSSFPNLPAAFHDFFNKKSITSKSSTSKNSISSMF